MVVIKGKPSHKSAAELLALESKAFNDVIVLDCTENMNGGKTYSYFMNIAKRKKYDFIMKADDDVFIHTPNIAKLIAKLPRKGLYFGRPHEDVLTNWFKLLISGW
jgi:Galactosyltransferase